MRQDAGDYVYPVEANVAPASKLNAVTACSPDLDIALDAPGDAHHDLGIPWDNSIETAIGGPYRALQALEDLRLLGTYVRVLASATARSRSVGWKPGANDRTSLEGEQSGRAVFGNYLVPARHDATVYRGRVPPWSMSRRTGSRIA